jgi:hypothetical protein
LKLNEINGLQGFAGVSLYQDCSPVQDYAPTKPTSVRQP